MRRRPLLLARFAASALAAGGIACGVIAHAQPISRAQVVALSPSIGRVEAQLDDGKVGVGSAITVAKGILVTNCHVTAKAVAIKVIGGGMPWQASEEVADMTHDVCFLRVPEWPHPPVMLRGANPLHVGDPVAALGFTAMAMTMRTGAITALHAHDNAQIIESDTAFNSGASGGGLFDQEGALIGMLTFRMRGPSRHYFSVPMQWIRERLPRENQWIAVAPLEKGRPFWAGDIDQLPLFMRAASLEEQKRWSDLRGVAEFWTVQDPDNADAYVALGIALRRLSATGAAIDNFSRAVALAPNNATAWFNLGRAFRASGNWGALQRVLDRLGELDEGLAWRLRNEAEESQTSGEISQ